MSSVDLFRKPFALISNTGEHLPVKSSLSKLRDSQ